MNRFCRVSNEPPNGFGGEHPRGNRPTRNKSHSRRPETIQITIRGERYRVDNKQSRWLWASQAAKETKRNFQYISVLLPAYSNAALEQAEGERLFFAAFFSRKESAFPCCAHSNPSSERPQADQSFFVSFFSKKETFPRSPPAAP